MLWAILISIHTASLVVYTILLRKSSTGKSDSVFLGATMMLGIWLPSLYFLFSGKVDFSLTFRQWFFLVLGGLFVGGLLIINAWALSFLDASMFSILYNLRLLMTTVFAYVVLGELPKVLQLVGGAIILLSIFMLNLHVDSKWKSKPILVGLFAMLYFSVHATLEKYNLGHVNVETYLFIFLSVGTIFTWLYVFAKKVDVKEQFEITFNRGFIVLLVARASSAFAYVYALKHGSLAISNYISGMSVVLIVLFGIYYLGERSDMKQKFGATAVAVAGMSLIMVSKILSN